MATYTAEFLDQLNSGKGETLYGDTPLTILKAFLESGFVVVDFEEPRLTADRFHLAKTTRQLKNAQTRPYSVAFKLRKQHTMV